MRPASAHHRYLPTAVQSRVPRRRCKGPVWKAAVNHRPCLRRRAVSISQTVFHTNNEPIKVPTYLLEHRPGLRMRWEHRSCRLRQSLAMRL